MIGYCKVHGYWSTPALGGDQSCLKCAEVEVLKSPPRPRRIGGLDLAMHHDFTAMTEMDVQFHSAKLVSVKTWPHVDYSVIIDQVADHYREVDMEFIGIDATSGSVGEPISEMFRKLGVHTDDVKFGDYVDWTNPWDMREHAPVKQAMVEYARACMQSGFVEIMEGGTEELRQQLAEQEIMPTSSDRIKYAHPQGRHDDLAWAFLINVYVARRYITGTGGWIKPIESTEKT